MKSHLLKATIVVLVMSLILATIAQAQRADSQILFASDREGRLNFEFFVMKADGTNVQNLTNHPAFDLHPSWSPDGTKIALSHYVTITTVKSTSWTSMVPIPSTSPGIRPRTTSGSPGHPT